MVLALLDIEQLWDRFEKRMLAVEGATRDTIMSYRSTRNLLLEYLKEHPVDEVSTQMVEDFLLWMADRGYSRNSIRRHYYALKKFLCYIGYCDKINWKAVRPKGEEKIDYIILSEDEVKLLIETAYKIKPLFGLMLQTGYEAALRVGELVSLKVRQLNLQDMSIIKRPLKREQPCEAPISPELAASLAQHVQGKSPDDYVFTTKFGRPWNRSVFHKYVFLRAAQEAGLLAKYPGLRYHDFARHTRATLLLRKGVDIYTVNRIMCHRLLQTTMVYLHIAQASELRKRMGESGV